MKQSIKFWVLAGTLSLGLKGCGGVNEEAQVATAVQTMMVLAVEAAIRYNIDSVASGTGPLECSGGGTYEPQNATLANLIDFIAGREPNADIDGEFEFTGCKISLCGSSITLNGAADFRLIGALSGSSRKINLIFTSDATTQVESEGIIAGAPEFRYLMEVDVTGDSLGNILIKDATPAAPLKYKGKVYRANQINDLAKGC
jgi:hypothetical protein